MELRSRKNQKEQKGFGTSRLSYGVANIDTKPMDKGTNKFLDFLMQTFLFILGGVILCAMIYAVLTFT